MKWQSIKTGVLVLVMSVLIWLYAEAEVVTTEKFPSVTVTLQAPDSQTHAVWLLEHAGDTIRVSLTVKVSSGSLASVREALSGTLFLSPGRGLPTVAGEHLVSLQTALRQNPAMANVTIEEVSPADVRVRVDNLASVMAPIHVVPPSGVTLAALPIADPPEARLYYPVSLGPGLPPEPRLTAVVEPERLSGTAATGQPIKVGDVRLQPPEGVRDRPGVRMEPSTAAVTLTVRSATDEYVKASVPVHLRIPDFLIDEWRITIAEEDRNLRDVKVTGPPQLVEDIRADRVPLIAYVPLTFEDVERRITSKDAVFFDLPPGGPGGLLRIEAADVSISLDIRPREPFVGPPPPPPQ